MIDDIRRFILLILFLILSSAMSAFVVYMLLSQENGGHPDRPRIGHPLPDFVLPDLEGSQVRFSDFSRGCVTVLCIWRERCPDCLPSFAVGNALAEEFAGRPDLRFLDVAYEGWQPRTGVWVKEAGICNKVLLDATGVVVRAYGIGTYTVFIADTAGILRYTGPVQEARQNLAEILGESRALPAELRVEVSAVPEISESSSRFVTDGPARTIRVVNGECLWTIARRELGSGVRWPEFARANHLPRPRLIRPGQKLAIPESEAAASSK